MKVNLLPFYSKSIKNVIYHHLFQCCDPIYAMYANVVFSHPARCAVLCRVLMLSESKIMLNGIELERNTLYTPRLHRRIQSVRQSASQSVTWVQLSNYIFLFLP